MTALPKAESIEIFHVASLSWQGFGNFSETSIAPASVLLCSTICTSLLEARGRHSVLQFEPYCMDTHTQCNRELQMLLNARIYTISPHKKRNFLSFVFDCENSTNRG